MIPKVLDWDRKYASEGELILAEEANKRSGLSGFQTTASLA